MCASERETESRVGFDELTTDFLLYDSISHDQKVRYRTKRIIPGLIPLSSISVPGQPVNLLATALSSNEIMLTWDQPLTSSAITEYVVHYNASKNVETNEQVIY